jgi:hypothetical protein
VSVHPSAGLNSELPLALIPTAGVPLLLALHITTLRILFRPEMPPPRASTETTP